MHHHIRSTRRTSRRAAGVITATAIAALGVSGCGLFPGHTFEDQAAVSQKITAIRLDIDSGGVTLRGGQRAEGGKVSVHRSVTYHGDRPEGLTHRVEDGVLVLRGCGTRCSVDYTVDLPAGLPVSGETSTGAVSLTKVGKVRVTTSTGDIDLNGVTGTADVRTTDGAITGRGLSGRGVTAETSNGEIDLTPGAPQNIRATTSNGAITVKVPAARYRVAAHTDNGAKNITVGNDPSGRFRLDLSTDNGEITADQLPGHRRR